MSKYNEFARRLDKAFRDVVQEYNDLVMTLNAAEKEVDRYSVVHSSLEAAQKEAAVAKLKAAKEEHRWNARKLFDQFCRDVDGITMDLKKAAASENVVNPADIDANAMELLKSGIMTAADYAEMVNRYSGNATMLRLIAKYANETRQMVDDPIERQRIGTAMLAAQEGSTSVVERFETLAAVAKTYCGKNAPDSIKYVQSMQEEWNGADIQAELENF